MAATKIVNIEEKLNKLSKSKSFQKKCKTSIKSNVKLRKKQADILEQKTDDIKDLLIDFLAARMRNSIVEDYIDAIEFTIKPTKNKTGNQTGLSISIGFDRAKSFAYSLYPQKYNGVILPILINYGYSAKHKVWGYPTNNPHSVSQTRYNTKRKIQGRQSREGEYFIQDAIDDFKLYLATTTEQIGDKEYPLSKNVSVLSYYNSPKI